MWILAELTRVTGMTDDHLRDDGTEGGEERKEGEKEILAHGPNKGTRGPRRPKKKEITKYDLPTLTLLLVAQWWQLPTLLHRISFFPTTVKICCKTIE